MNILENISAFQNLIYIAASILFITGIKMLGKEDTAVKGNLLSALAMFIAVLITFLDPDVQVNPFLNIFNILSVTKNPPTTLTVAQIKAAKPR
jgi:NAD(P) transhydrogenase subunit beta